jgi:hypothetical protein
VVLGRYLYRWTVEGYATLLRGLHDKLDVRPLLLGAKADVPYAQAIQQAAGSGTPVWLTEDLGP